MTAAPVETAEPSREMGCREAGVLEVGELMRGLLSSGRGRGLRA